MDAFARGLKVAHRLLESGEIEDFIAERYKSWQSGIGKEIIDGKVGFKELAEYALQNDSPIALTSGRQEMLENILTRYILD